MCRLDVFDRVVPPFCERDHVVDNECAGVKMRQRVVNRPAADVAGPTLLGYSRSKPCLLCAVAFHVRP